ncbi:methylated-DNA-[protein]-cysteine S-methyltransferase [Streptomyces zagrosensis]|uniref:Methylated-DNA--protein-cysteine methyltransferase n=1 Tax=Streptomyces zagrosensis TaxID=1042984 RepID=A0A7W9Q6R9_9ACTN|nr:methylated-DNA-[protein]-cysteine S-methyltransferase [Streptomyces zagrosensis]
MNISEQVDQGAYAGEQRPTREQSSAHERGQRRGSAHRERPAVQLASRSWAWQVTDSTIGPLLLVATDQGLVQVVFHADEKRVANSLDGLGRRLGAAGSPSCDHPVIAEAVRQLDAYFAGELRDFTLPLDWCLTSGFNRQVLRELVAHVSYGAVVGYQDLAIRVGEPGAARAVGVAMGANPLPVVVPCHRVVESDGGIGGFGGGLETKRSLLALEGVLPQPLF